jgi:hypothetical protein
VTQLRWVADDGRLMVRLEGQPEGSRRGGGGMRGAALDAADKTGKSGKWFQSLLALADQY